MGLLPVDHRRHTEILLGIFFGETRLDNTIIRQNAHGLVPPKRDNDVGSNLKFGLLGVTRHDNPTTVAAWINVVAKRRIAYAQ
jgi:hypothetical protein